MRKYDDPVRVELNGKWPARVHWRARALRVLEVADWWVVQWKWWSGERGEKRVHFRLLTDHGIIELYRSRDSWTLYRLAD